MDAMLIAKIVTLAGRAPSAHNAQPWRVEISEDRFVVWRETSRTLGAGDPTLRQTYIGLGLFIEALSYALSGFGYESETIIYAFDPRSDESAAEVIVGGQIQDEDPTKIRLLEARRTSRSIYSSEPTPEEVVRDLLTMEMQDGLAIWVASEDAQRVKIAEIVRDATKVALAVPDVREELASYVSYASEARPFGLAYESLTDEPKPSCSAVDWVLNILSIEDEAELALQRFANASLHFGISASWESADAWIEVGRTLHRALMHITSHGFNHYIAAGPIEIPTLALRLRAIVGCLGKPQVLVSVGRAVNQSSFIPSRRLSSIDIQLPGT